MDLKQQDFALDAWSSIKACSKVMSSQYKAHEHTSIHRIMDTVIHKTNSLNSVAIRGYIRCISATVLQWDAWLKQKLQLSSTQFAFELGLSEKMQQWQIEATVFFTGLSSSKAGILKFG
jgi:hypothetical protein